jgi:hypothetical protein
MSAKHRKPKREEAPIERELHAIRSVYNALRPLKLHQRIEVVRAIRCIFRMPEPGAS